MALRERKGVGKSLLIKRGIKDEDGNKYWPIHLLHVKSYSTRLKVLYTFDVATELIER